MKSLKINLELSKKIYEIVQDYIELKGCYNNTFNAMSYIAFSEKFNLEDYRIGYGFLNKPIGNESMFFRHGYIISNKDNSVIDVTACLWGDIKNKCCHYDYYTFKEYTMDEYTDALIECDGMPALYEVTQDEEISIYNELIKSGMVCNPIDFMDLLNRIYKERIIEGIYEYNEGKSILCKACE